MNTFQLHHPRPRFKGDLENVLGWVAISVAEIGVADSKIFNEKLDEQIRHFINDDRVTEKTVQNWRTEISALFGFFIQEDQTTSATAIAVELANELNFPKFFRQFIQGFQYPGGHIRPDFIVEVVEKGILFHPGRFIAKMLLYAAESHPGEAYLTRAEFCHCCLNDLSVTKGQETPASAFKRILGNRSGGTEYDERSDVIRSAGDILDYMVLGRLLVLDSKEYSIAPNNRYMLEELANSTNIFTGYEGVKTFQEAKCVRPQWFKYVVESAGLVSDAVPALPGNPDLESAGPATAAVAPTPVVSAVRKDTNAIGNKGEELALKHEKLRIKNAGRTDLVHLIKRIPSHFAMGYDINSTEADERKRFVEVKTSESSSKFTLNSFHLTTNEWVVAEEHGKSYFVYRLQLTDEGARLFIIQDPVGKYKSNKLRMVPRDGADIFFNPDECGGYEDLLT